MREYGIPIMFDVSAEDRDTAAAVLVEVLSRLQIPGTSVREDGDSTTPAGVVESWWTIDARDKRFDGNDNDPGAVMFFPQEL